MNNILIACHNYIIEYGLQHVLVMQHAGVRLQDHSVCSVEVVSSIVRSQVAFQYASFIISLHIFVKN